MTFYKSPNYHNKEWLKQKYIDEKLSTYDIAKLCKTWDATIGDWLKKFDIPIRSNIEAKTMRWNLKDTRYQSKEWLKDKYLNEKLSINQIAKLCAISFSTMWYWFKKHNILIRSMKESTILGKKGKVNWNKGIKTFDEKLYAKEYYKNNKEKIDKYCRQWRKNNLKHYMQVIRQWQNRKRKIDLKYNLNKRISTAISLSLKGNKAGRHWELLVNYTLNDLIKRLKRTMPKNYNWQNYLNGDLHIDHIIPISAFNFNKPENYDFQRCWALGNLRLLPAKENLEKSNKLTRPFQPALKI